MYVICQFSIYVKKNCPREEEEKKTIIVDKIILVFYLCIE